MHITISLWSEANDVSSFSLAYTTSGHCFTLSTFYDVYVPELHETPYIANRIVQK